MDLPSLATTRVGVIGLGYVGLPLATAFSQHYPVVGYDIDVSRVDEIRHGHDRTLEVTPERLAQATNLRVTAASTELAPLNVYIVTAPTPIDEHKRPNLEPVLLATRTIAEHLAPGDVVIYESTVYPGATEEECVPLLERLSGLTYNEHFTVGYSPERINPGDKQHRFETILKVTSGSTPQTADFVDSLYGSVVTAGTHKAPSIKVAEAAKVIENTQRDVNIALVNELALVFRKLGIDTHEVLEAASTKWNFLPFKPGLVGGHCIGVDPYYLTHKAQAIGYHPELILAGRRINDFMGRHVADELLRHMIGRSIDLRQARVLVLGLAFKEDTPDVRNTKVIDIIRHLESFGIEVDVHDSWVDPRAAKEQYGVGLLSDPLPRTYDGIVVAVGHSEYRAWGAEGIRHFARTEDSVLFDLKAILPRESSDLRL